MKGAAEERRCLVGLSRNEVALRMQAYASFSECNFVKEYYASTTYTRDVPGAAVQVMRRTRGQTLYRRARLAGKLVEGRA